MRRLVALFASMTILTVALTQFLLKPPPSAAGDTRRSGGSQPAEHSAAVIVIHGGGWYSGTPQRVASICKAVGTQLALPCFTPAYTLSTVAPFPAANDDLFAAVGLIHGLGYTRIGVIGESAGGNLAAWLAARGLVDVAVVWSAPSDLTVPAHTWRTKLREHVRAFAPTPGARRDASPALRGVDVPLLIVNSNNELVPVSQARELFRAATGPRRLTILDGRLHAAQYAALELPETLAWLDAYL